MTENHGYVYVVGTIKFNVKRDFLAQQNTIVYKCERLVKYKAVTFLPASLLVLFMSDWLRLV